MSQAARRDRDLLVVGRASRLPLVQELDAALPLPFAPDSDSPLAERVAVVYRLPLNKELGYLELIPAPWDTSRLVVLVLGNSGRGLQAAAALTSSGLRRKLAGDAAVVDGEQLFVSASSLSVTHPAPGASPTPAPPEAATRPPVGRPRWLLPALIASVVAMGVIGLVAWVGARRRAGTAE
ncbi:MAG: hypothetical protein ACE5G8_13890 [Anaerolineae bacterium]